MDDLTSEGIDSIDIVRNPGVAEVTCGDHNPVEGFCGQDSSVEVFGGHSEQVGLVAVGDRLHPGAEVNPLVNGTLNLGTTYEMKCSSVIMAQSLHSDGKDTWHKINCFYTCNIWRRHLSNI